MKGSRCASLTRNEISWKPPATGREPTAQAERNTGPVPPHSSLISTVVPRAIQVRHTNATPDRERLRVLPETTQISPSPSDLKRNVHGDRKGCRGAPRRQRSGDDSLRSDPAERPSSSSSRSFRLPGLRWSVRCKWAPFRAYPLLTQNRHPPSQGLAWFAGFHHPCLVSDVEGGRPLPEPGHGSVAFIRPQPLPCGPVLSFKESTA